MSTLNDRIAENVRRLLVARGMKKKTFADRIGIEPSQFRRLLKGTGRWNADHHEKVAVGLDIDPMILLK